MLEPFAASRCLTLGVELELQLVSTYDYDLVPVAHDLLRVLDQQGFKGDVKLEITDSMIEVATGICRNHGEALEQLTGLRDGLLRGARQLDIGSAVAVPIPSSTGASGASPRAPATST